MNPKTVCILGGTGFVGGHILNRLEAAGHSARVLTRSLRHAAHLAVFPGVEVIEAEVFEPLQLKRHFAGCDAVVNLVGILHEQWPGAFKAVHADLPRKLAEACAAAGVPRLLHMSALHADPAAPSAYLRSKGEGQAAVLEPGRGVNATVFRPSVIFGPGDSFLNLFARLLKLAPLLPLGSPEAKFQPVYVHDVAQAFVASLENAASYGQAYDLCGPKTYTLRQLVELAGRLTGHPRRIVGLGPRLSYLQAWAMEWKPGKKILTRDNVLSMRVDSVCACEFPALFGIKPSSLEAVAPAYLSEIDRLREFRAAAGR